MLCCLSTLSIWKSKHVMHSMLYVEAVDTKHIHTFLPITFLIFNRFSIRKKFWKYYICWHCRHKTRISNAFNAMYVDTVNTKHIYTFLPITFLIFSWFSIRKKFWKYYICWHCRHKTRISNAFNAMYVDTVNTKHIYTFLPITFLIFSWFSICKKFWKAET